MAAMAPPPSCGVYLLVKGSWWRGIRQQPAERSPTTVWSALIHGFETLVSSSATELPHWEAQEFSASSDRESAAYCMH